MPSDLNQRLENLEDLVLRNRDKVGKRTGVPFIVFSYPPSEEFDVEPEIEGFAEKLRYNEQNAELIDMRDLFFRTLENQGISEGVFEREQNAPDELSDGLKQALLETGDTLGPLPTRIVEASESADTVLVYRMGILYPFASASLLMSLLEGEVESDIPIVFFYPAATEQKSLRFLNGSEGTYYRAKVF
jgi:hypothetical protein